MTVKTGCQGKRTWKTFTWSCPYAGQKDKAKRLNNTRDLWEGVAEPEVVCSVACENMICLEESSEKNPYLRLCDV